MVMTAVKKIGITLATLTIITAFLGMSSFEKSSLDKIPIPDKNFTVLVLDQADVRTTVTQFSFDGATYLTGARGKGKFSISLEKIKQIDFRLMDDVIEATTELTNGLIIKLSPEYGLLCYGRTEFGTFVIKLGDIKQLIIQKQSTKN